MWFKHGKKGKEKSSLTPPEGMTAADIATQSSIYTGETLIGFWTRKPGVFCRPWWYEMRQILLHFIKHMGTNRHVGIDKKIPIHI